MSRSAERSKPEDLINIARKMSTGEPEALFELRKLVVDLTPSDIIGVNSNQLIAAIFVAKQIDKDVWFNLATDASFDFPLPNLSEFTDLMGKAILCMIEETENEGPNAYALLGSAIKTLYAFFVAIEQNPSNQLKGLGHGIVGQRNKENT